MVNRTRATRRIRHMQRLRGFITPTRPDPRPAGTPSSVPDAKPHGLAEQPKDQDRADEVHKDHHSERSYRSPPQPARSTPPRRPAIILVTYSPQDRSTA